MNRLAALAAKRERLCLGLVSGTSADGVDTAVVRVAGTAEDLSLEVLHAETSPYPPFLREKLLAAVDFRVPALAELHFSLGGFFGRAALDAIRNAGFAPADIDLIGSHGQTVYHAPPDSRAAAGATLQIGDGCAIAGATGIVTVSDFRAADIAAGGQGAPLVPYLDRALFRNLPGTTVALNLGGIANITVVPGRDAAFPTVRGGDPENRKAAAPAPPGREAAGGNPEGREPSARAEPRREAAGGNPAGGEGSGGRGPDGLAAPAAPAGQDQDAVTGFDTGPANMLLDSLAARLLPGAPPFDEDGAAAARGRIDERLLRRLLRNPYFEKRPPKSTGREDFGAPFADELLAGPAGKLRPEDLLATAAALTAETVAAAVRAFTPTTLAPPARVVASGGGVHNRTLMAMLAERLAPIPLTTSADFGVPADGKEAVLFALLASEAVSGTPAGLPQVTGAKAPRVLGKISLP